MFCIKCGKENQGESKFCYYCGAEMPPSQSVVNNVSNSSLNLSNNTIVEESEYFIDYKKCKTYFGKNYFFWEVFCIILMVISIIFIIANADVFKFDFGSGIFLMIIPIVVGIPLMIFWLRYKILYRIPTDSWYDDMSFSYKSEITNTAIKRCGMDNVPKSDFKQIVFCGYATDRVRRVKMGKDYKSRSEVPEITVLFLFNDHVRYYSTKIYTLKRNRVINNIGTILYKDIMSVNIGEAVIRGHVFSKLKFVTLSGGMIDFAAADTVEANLIIEEFKRACIVREKTVK